MLPELDSLSSMAKEMLKLKYSIDVDKLTKDDLIDAMNMFNLIIKGDDYNV